MAVSPPSHGVVILVTALLLLSSASFSHAFLVSNLRTLFSVSHSLTCRVAALRTARGDTEGAARARALADQLERGLGLGFYRFAVNLGWDYVKNYAWRETASALGNVVTDLNELLQVFSELNGCNSDGERVAWVAGNYRNALRISNSLISQLLKVFTQSGPLREVVIALQKEVVDGDMLRDYLELGASDLHSLIQAIKDLFLQYTFHAHRHPEL